MKVYILIDTTSNNEILGVYSSEILAKEDAESYNMPESGEMSEIDKYNLSRMEIKSQTIDERLF